MALIQYITRKKKKEVLSMQDLNIIKQRVDGIYNNRIEVLDLDALEKCQKTLKLMPYEIKRVGVMVAAPPSQRIPGVILIGYSLCHQVDRFDHMKIQVDEDWAFFDPQKGRGQTIAAARAFKWAQALGPQTEKYAASVPHSIRKDLKKFMTRASHYYKGNQLPSWALVFMDK